MNFLYDLLACTALEMTEPKPYGLFHILFTLVGGAVSVYGAWRLRNADDRTHRAVLLTVGLALAVSEIYKQLFHTVYLNGGVYNWSILPYQLCSVPMYLCLLAPFLSAEKQQTVYAFMCTYNLLGGLMSFLFPSGLCHPYWTLTLHAFGWHMLLVFLGMYLAVSGRMQWSGKTFAQATRLFLLLCAIAFGINCLLGPVSEWTVNMFYIGPPKTPQPVFKVIAEYMGQAIASVLYIGCIMIGAWLLMRGMGHAAVRRSGRQLLGTSRSKGRS